MRKRGVAIVQKKYVVVRDELQTLAQPALVRWTMLTDATVKVADNYTVELGKNGKKMKLIVQDTAGVIMKTWPTNPPPHDYDAANPGTTLVGFEVTIPANSQRALTVILLPGTSTINNLPAATMLAGWPNSLH